MNKYELNSRNIKELEGIIEDLGEKKFRASQIFNFFHANKGGNLMEAQTLPKKLREDLLNNHYVGEVSIFQKFESQLDDTKKYLFKLQDNNIIESVAMKYEHGVSICISTQVGCRMGCVFCASTKDGLIRNLSAGEMLGQIYEIEKDLSINISNVVLMGSGEPLDNYDEVIRFINLISDEKGQNLSKRSITLSTCGLVPEIYRLADENIPITLAISLHSAFDDDRRKIMPIANRYSIEEIIDSTKYYLKKTGRRITFEYTIIEGVNDRIEDGEKLVDLFKGLNMHLNLIPLNPIKEYNKKEPSNDRIKKFKNILDRNKIQATIRREMGQDISASCGQLRRSVLEPDS